MKAAQLDMFTANAAARNGDGPLSTTAYLAALAEARRIKRTCKDDAYSAVFEYLSGQVRTGQIYQTDAMVIWRGVSRQYKTPFG